MASPFGSPGPAGHPDPPTRVAGVCGAASGYSPGRVQLHPVGGKKPSLFCPVFTLPHGSLFALLKDVTSLPRLAVRRRRRRAMRAGPCRGQSVATFAWRSSSRSRAVRLGSSKKATLSSSCCVVSTSVFKFSWTILFMVPRLCEQTSTTPPVRALRVGRSRTSPCCCRRSFFHFKRVCLRYVKGPQGSSVSYLL